MLVRVKLLLAVAVLGLAACSHQECVIDTDCPLAKYCTADTHTCVAVGGDSGVHDAGVGEGGVRDGSSDGPASDGSGDLGRPDMGDGHTRIGSVVATSTADGSRTDVVAGFDDYAHYGCTTRTDGPCSITECPASGGTPTHHASGTLTVQNGTHVATVMPAADATYASTAVMPAIWTGGQTVDVATSGGDVPAFHVMLAGPGATMLTAPTVAASGYTLVRSSDVALTWTPGIPMATGAQQLVYLSWADTAAGGASTTAICRYALAGGSGTLPATAMSVFPMGMTGTYAFAVATEMSTMAGGYAVTVTLGTLATMPSGDGPATGTVTFM